MISDEALVQSLSGIVGSEHVLAGEAARSFAIDGKAPRAVVSPASVEEVSAVMLLAHAEGLKVIPRGNGTKMGLGALPEQVHLIIVLTRMNRLVDHEPADMTATFEAGMTLKEAQAILGRNGQCLALDPPHSDTATIGGILATNSSGPWRLRYGTSRDLVLAVQVVHADGKVTKGGAKVVKNVAGYDMSKLYIGSLGTLAIIVAVSFRLYPKTAFEGTYLAPFASIDSVWEVAAGILDSPIVASAVEILNPEASRHAAGLSGLPWGENLYSLAVAVGSVRREAVDAQLGRVKQICSQAGISEGHLLIGQPHDQFWQMTRDPRWDSGPRALLKASVLPNQLVQGVKLAEEIAGREGLGVEIISDAGSGIIRTYLFGKSSSTEEFTRNVAEVVHRLRTFALESEGSLVVLEAPTEVKNKLDIWGPVGKTLTLMQSLKAQFDPGRILNPGRFVGGI